MLGGPGWHMEQGGTEMNPEEYEKWLSDAAMDVSAHFGHTGRPMTVDAVAQYLKTSWSPPPDDEEVIWILKQIEQQHGALGGRARPAKPVATAVLIEEGYVAALPLAVEAEVQEKKPKRMTAKRQYEAWLNEAACDAYRWFAVQGHTISGERLAQYLRDVWKPKPRKTEIKAIADRLQQLMLEEMQAKAPEHQKALYDPEAIIPWSKAMFPRGSKRSKGRRKSNPGRGKYYVKAKSQKAAGLKGWKRGPYTLEAAKTYARIGSQEGRDRYVMRGESGPVVRRYRGGERVWPKQPAQLRGLLPKERPREL